MNNSAFGRRRKPSTHAEVKIAVTGLRGVGKSAITVRFLTKRFIGEYGHEQETKYHHQTKIDGDIVSMEILDINSQDIFTDTQLIEWADGIMLVYSVTDRESFEALWKAQSKISEARKSFPVPFTLVANKQDLLHAQVVDITEGRELANELGCSFKVLSAAENYKQIVDTFYDLYRDIKMLKHGAKPSIMGRMFGRGRKPMTL
ncbi:ras-related and estrogen-regulated growth inhibitor-like [Antedon mediterranea]|uniref:ras-related and estrogen-regulated growth inhibitor-like n=1 Tax=Antedon mediterranea TaxID=105859 RepID=UPI003AF43811